MVDREAGWTLVEVVLAIVLLGILGPVLLTLAGSLAPPFYQGEALIRAAALAHELESEVLSRRFDELLERGGDGNWSVTLGPELGETRPQWDDVDDFHGFSETLTGDFAGYARSVSVTYAATLWAMEAPFGDGSGSIVPGFSTASSYKLITLRVTGPAGVDVSYEVLATTANSQGAPAQ